MTTLLLDTSVVSYLFKGHSLAHAYQPHLTGRILAVSFMTVGELYEGAYRAGWGAARLGRLETMLKQNYVVVPSSHDVCVHWGEVRAERKAQTISPEDAWIAATARAHGWPLVIHNLGGFANVSGLQVITEHRATP